MRDDLDDIKKDPTGDDTSSDSFLKIDPIKNLDISNIKVETETKIEEPKKSPDKQTKEDIPQNDKPVKDNSKIIKIGIAVLIVILCLVGGYFAYSKFMASDESEEFVENTETEEVVEETPQELVVEESTNPEEEPIAEESQELIEEEQEGGPVSEENIEEETISEENSIQVNDDNYDLVVLEKVYDEVINRGNEAYLSNFSSEELAIIRNTLYAKNGYKFKKKEYQKYFGEKSWYNPTTSSQNILTKQEEKLANIIKRYE
ncbi:serine/threonine protein kinase [Fusobacterium polymorphum]|uniref:Serine/threonine protein kinase n=1 Tax=Fusobacterium nucleatum subsp. polymorphum TaxID=76857 RepID=A0A2B7YNS6_FUSNP|nr:YARHG domain-containing protein [Fusobacterium polymorphum]PGH22709.1 serine/threonine protein kinase [Fusobacterium polymorphum]